MNQRFDLSKRVATLRIVFGVIWLIDAGLKMNSTFIHEFQGDFTEGAAGQPSWLKWWFDFWADVTGSNPHAFAYGTIAVELLIGFGLVLGLARKVGYVGGFIFSIAIWMIPEGLGGPYSMSSTDINQGIIYALVFAALYGLDSSISARHAWTLDEKMERRFPWWRSIAEP